MRFVELCLQKMFHMVKEQEVYLCEVCPSSKPNIPPLKTVTRQENRKTPSRNRLRCVETQFVPNLRVKSGKMFKSDGRCYISTGSDLKREPGAMGSGSVFDHCSVQNGWKLQIYALRSRQDPRKLSKYTYNPYSTVASLVDYTADLQHNSSNVQDCVAWKMGTTTLTLLSPTAPPLSPLRLKSPKQLIAGPLPLLSPRTDKKNVEEEKAKPGVEVDEAVSHRKSIHTWGERGACRVSRPAARRKCR
jgi:hypothetical protein